jgi:hypothetical protein
MGGKPFVGPGVGFGGSQKVRGAEERTRASLPRARVAPLAGAGSGAALVFLLLLLEREGPSSLPHAPSFSLTKHHHQTHNPPQTHKLKGAGVGCGFGIGWGFGGGGIGFGGLGVGGGCGVGAGLGWGWGAAFGSKYIIVQPEFEAHGKGAHGSKGAAGGGGKGAAGGGGKGAAGGGGGEQRPPWLAQLQDQIRLLKWEHRL